MLLSPKTAWSPTRPCPSNGTRAVMPPPEPTTPIGGEGHLDGKVTTRAILSGHHDSKQSHYRERDG